MNNYALRILANALAVAFASAITYAQDTQHTPAEQQSIGLVLSGGGAKGIAHIGVLQALEENDIPIDYITGTSMGAIVGGLYAAGYTPKEMLQLILSKPFSYWSTGQIDPDLVYYFTTEEPSPVMLSLPVPSKRDSILQAKEPVMASLISPMPMNFAFMDLFAAQTAACGGNFDNLFVPFRCVASDAAAKHKVVLSHGDLGYSVRSSMSFPVVFQPTQLNDSLLLYDGGIYDNFPADVMRQDFAPDFTIGVDVSTDSSGPQTSLMDQIENLVIQGSDYYLDPATGIKLKYDLNSFGLLDFPLAKQIYQIGYDYAIQMMDSIKGRVHSRTSKEDRELRRAVFKSKLPYINFSDVTVYGAQPRQNTYLEYLFHSSKKDSVITIDQARQAYYRAISPGKLRDLVPHAYYNDSTGLFDLRMRAAVKDNLKVGFGGYITSSTSSYVYLSAGYSTLSFSSISSSLGAWLGQSYLGAALNSRIYMRTHIPSALELQVVAFRQKYYDSDYLFFEEKSPSFILDHEYFARLRWAWAAGSLFRAEIGLGYGHLNDSFYQPDTSLGYLSQRDNCYFNLGQAFMRLQSNTLDDINYPTKGRMYNFTLMGVMGDCRHKRGESSLPAHRQHPRWIQFESVTRNYFTFGRHFAFGVESDVIVSTRKLLHDYNATMVTAPAFLPTPACYNSFNPSFRANSFVSAGIVPIYKFNSSLSARVSAYAFMPLREISQDAQGQAVYSHKWLSHPKYFGEFDLCYSLPFATITGYCNYLSAPTGDWNVGISFGVFLPAPRFLR